MCYLMLGYDSVQQKTLPKFHYMYLIKQLGINLVPWVHETCLLRSSYMKVFIGLQNIPLDVIYLFLKMKTSKSRNNTVIMKPISKRVKMENICMKLAAPIICSLGHSLCPFLCWARILLNNPLSLSFIKCQSNNLA